jgi:site-specific DNA-methyltransferase (adenine-specific)
LKLIYKTEYGKLVHGDNIEVMIKLKDNSVDSCISDFPYDLSFMGKKWDTTGNFYDWCKERAKPLYRIIKPGGYVCIFGHPKTNHRMKCAFEDVGFKIVEEIDWVYGSGFPKNQDIGKLFDKKVGAIREIIGNNPNARKSQEDYSLDKTSKNFQATYNPLSNPSTEQATKWNGWKTAGLKPAHEPITVFQKPLEGTYINNIDTYGVGGMNIDACRIPTSQEDKNIINAKSSKNPTTNYSDKDDKIYGAYAEDKAMPANEIGRFPANMIFDSFMGEVLDGQSGESRSVKGKPRTAKIDNSIKLNNSKDGTQVNCEYNDKGGASRYFLNIDVEDFVPFLYCAKATKKEKGEGNTHVTVKPKALIKWLIKLVTPINGKTIDITAGSGTHGLSAEELNKEEGYNLKWINIEMMNTEKEPYCDIAMNRIKAVNI